jgi:hypothetical protein
VNGGGYGQNLAAYGTSSTGPLDLPSLVEWSITDEWYDGELAYIPWGEDSPSTSGPEFLHATQVIWKASIEVGCATVQCAAGTIFGMTSWYTGKLSILHCSTDLTDPQKSATMVLKAMSSASSTPRSAGPWARPMSLRRSRRSTFLLAKKVPS